MVSVFYTLVIPMLNPLVYSLRNKDVRLSDFTFTFHFHALEKEMATHSSVLAWRIPGTGVWWAAVYGVAQCSSSQLGLTVDQVYSQRSLKIVEIAEPEAVGPGRYPVSKAVQMGTKAI